MACAGTVVVIHLVHAKHHLERTHHVAVIALQRHIQPGVVGHRRHDDRQDGCRLKTNSFDISHPRLELVGATDFLQFQTAIKEAGTAKHIAIAQPLAFVDAFEAYSEVVLPGACIDLDAGQLLGTVEHHQEVARHVVADLVRQDVLALLLQWHVGHRQQHVFAGLQADPVPVEVTDIGAHQEAVHHLVRVHIALLGDVCGVDDLGRWRLHAGAIDRAAHIEAGHVGQHEAGHGQRQVVRLFLGDQFLAGEGNACSHEGS